MVRRPRLRQPESMNEDLLVTKGFASGDASRGLLLGGEAREQAGYCCLGGGQVLLAASQHGLKVGQLGPQRRVRAIGDAAYVRTPVGPNLDDAVRREQSDGYVGRPWRGRHLRAFFACMYFAALRPGEVKALRKDGCYLPASGWGKLTLSRSRPQSNKRWTDSGEAFDDRGLKHRAESDTRSVPIPPALVTILREHIEEFGTAADGRLFRTARGGMIYDTTHTWAVARTLALAPEQVASPLAARPYDLRHAAVSLWLNGGVAVTEVANRAGHSVEVLLRVYAKCIDGGEEAANRRIDEALAA
jgi:integrase